jgi:hypothetical protein
VSVTVTAPTVGPPPTLLTVMVYVSAASPWRNVPECVLAIVRSAAAGAIGVTSDAELLAVLTSPPPATVAVLVTLTGALAATLTVNVNAG